MSNGDKIRNDYYIICIGKASVIEQWHEALSQMREHTHIYPDIGHFVEEYKGSEIAASILSNLNGFVD